MARSNINTAPESSGGLFDLMEKFLFEKTKNIHTQIIGKVTEVNYKEGWVNVKPQIRTVKEFDNLSGEIVSEIEYPEIFEVPLSQISAKRGKARITMPVAVGDVGELSFSERDTYTYLNSSGGKIQNSDNVNSLSQDGKPFSLSFTPEIFTAAENKEINSTDIVIENEKSQVNIKPDGTVVVKFSGFTLTLDSSSGNVAHSSGSLMTGTGDFITSEGYSLKTLWEKTYSHTHGNVQNGEGTTSDINS